ncbi:hypothetical protein K438DRAFT_1805799, partial [Mycena galopus ATCC 62051]
GHGCVNETNLPLAQVLEDVDRIAWVPAIDEGLPCCLDNFEWSDGYNVRFGLINVAYDAAGQGSQQRNPKLSGAYLRGVLTQSNP